MTRRTGMRFVAAALLLAVGAGAREAPVAARPGEDLVAYVDPLIGTGGNGHTFPGATVPFGMVQLSPSNDRNGWNWTSGYHYSDEDIKGFAHTHISGAGLSALGDILLETHGLTVGAVAFLVGHLIAIGLYLRYRRPNLPKGDAVFAALLVPVTVAIAFLLPSDRAMAPGVALYSTGLALMAACAWICRFPRAMTGLGALMFVVSDLLIFARGGPLAGQAWVGYGVWILYYFGQVLIALGGVRGLSRERRL